MHNSRNRVILVAIAVTLGAALGFVWSRWRGTAKPTAAANPTVAIQDGKTIDFSSGKPVVKDGAAEKAIIEKAEKEMTDAAKDVTFAPTTKKAEPSKATPPKP
jgi:hypothetical protein